MTTLEQQLQIAKYVSEIIEKASLSDEDRDVLKVFIRLYISQAKDIEDIRNLCMKK